MNGAALAVLGTIIGIIAAIVGIYFTARNSARTQAKERADALQGRYNDGYQAGQKDATPASERFKDQRDEARRERDRLQLENDRLQARNDHLEDELRAR